jgi:hypothetical protein
MPVVKVWNLPPSSTDEERKALRREIVAGAASVPEVSVKDGTNMAVLFPKVMISHGLGTEIIIEVTSGMFAERRLGPKGRRRFAMEMVRAVKKFHREAMVECFILPYRRSDGFYHCKAGEEMHADLPEKST